MSESQTLIARIGTWFRRGTGQDGHDSNIINGENGPPMYSGGGDNGLEPRNTFLRPWAKRDQAIDNLHRGIGALSDLLVSIRENMEKQSQRQEELLGHLSSLPEAIQSIPEGSRVQGEALKAIHDQMERQSTQQSKLGDVLERMSHNDAQQGKTLDALQQTIAALNEHDQINNKNLHALGSALESMTSSSQTSAQVLQQLRDNTSARDSELERVIKRQNTRFTTLLTVAIVLSVAALSTVAVFGYLAYEALTKAK